MAPLRAGLCLAALSWLAGCGPVLTHGTPLSEVLAAEQSAVAKPYTLQPGDQLEVHHVLDPDYSALVVVAPDGTINVPGIASPVVARGQTIDELGHVLDRQYRQASLLKSPFFSLNLKSFGSLQIFIGGEVQRPGYLELTGGNRTLLQVIMAAGGLADTARRKEVIVLRTVGGGRTEIFSVDLSRVISGEDLTQNVRVQPLDVVYVPKSDIASLDTWMDKYVRQALPLSSNASVVLTNQSNLLAKTFPQ
jgi:protein involved in polysaccharide export with SLBB domain